MEQQSQTPRNDVPAQRDDPELHNYVYMGGKYKSQWIDYLVYYVALGCLFAMVAGVLLLTQCTR